MFLNEISNRFGFYLALMLAILAFTSLSAIAADASSHATAIKKRETTNANNNPSEKAVIAAFIAKLDMEDDQAKESAKREIPTQQAKIPEIHRQYEQCITDACIQNSPGVWTDSEKWKKYRSSGGLYSPQPYLSLERCQASVKIRCNSILGDVDFLERSVKNDYEIINKPLRSSNWVFSTNNVKNYEGTIIAVIDARRKGSDHSFDWKVTMHSNGSSLVVDGYTCIYEQNGTGNEVCYNGGSLE